MADEPQIEETTTIEDSEPQEVTEEQPEESAKPFEGEYDPERARRTIDKLRDEVRDLKQKKDAPQPDPEAGKLAVENLQLKVALETGLTAKQAARLRGATREEMLEDAHDLFEAFAPRKEEPKSQQPRPRLKGGSQPETEPETSAKDISASLRV
ncbi:hypothetical protein MUN76_15330 [Leucobacter rhizosphaerae]|uniref:Scaffolding protein n=1 Tax=Leucobacter rhizosphaerae TaxID=2932245 RepID=A0ABY4FVN5_9MICO|nr:hypothetical protein [Leucobacter rhizosphaerae]UOQ60380.1 hypothetical protein MUN76_15330 [Leucobacter rhizosphaerae]